MELFKREREREAGWGSGSALQGGSPVTSVGASFGQSPRLKMTCWIMGTWAGQGDMCPSKL